MQNISAYKAPLSLSFKRERSFKIMPQRTFLSLYFLKDLVYLFLEGKGGRKGEKHQCVVASHVRPLLGTWPTTQACALVGNQTGDPLLHRPALNPLSNTSEGRTFLLKCISNIPKVWIRN